MKKVLIVCGNGLGSSFIVEMNVKKILAEMNKEAEVAHTDLTSAKSETADLILSAKDIAEHLSSHSAKVVGLSNFTPGHSPGHQSFIIRLPGGTNFTLAIDAAYTLDHYHEKALPGLMTSATDVAQSVRKLRQLTERYHAVFIPGHDPEEWKKNRLAPACYY